MSIPDEPPLVRLDDILDDPQPRSLHTLYSPRHISNMSDLRLVPPPCSSRIPARPLAAHPTLAPSCSSAINHTQPPRPAPNTRALLTPLSLTTLPPPQSVNPWQKGEVMVRGTALTDQHGRWFDDVPLLGH